MSEHSKYNGEQHSFSPDEVKLILEVNRKSIELYTEIINQNDTALRELETLRRENQDMRDIIQRDMLKRIENTDRIVSEELKPKMIEIDKYLFRLFVFLGLIGVGIVYQVIGVVFGHR